MAIGFQTRIAVPLAWLSIVSLHHRNPVSFNSGDSVQRLLVLLLCFTPSGTALSVDCWLSNEDFWLALRVPSVRPLGVAAHATANEPDLPAHGRLETAR